MKCNPFTLILSLSLTIPIWSGAAVATTPLRVDVDEHANAAGIDDGDNYGETDGDPAEEDSENIDDNSDGTEKFSTDPDHVDEAGPASRFNTPPVTSYSGATSSTSRPTVAVGPALNGRAAASAPAQIDGARTEGTTSSLAMWYTGSLAAGAQQHWTWNNAGTYVYKVGFAPAGASSASACQFQAIRTWDIQQPGGEREFHFIVQNTGTISCGANILLQSQAASNTWATGTLSAGATTTWTWNNANPLTAAHFANVNPSGATSTKTCEIEVIRSWYGQLASKERRFYMTLKNVGTISCAGTLLLATNTNVASSWSTGTIAPGKTAAWYWGNANPLNRVFVPGVSPLGATTAANCQLELLPTAYVQILNADRTTQRRYSVGVKNVGTISCSGTLLLNYLDPSNTNPLPVNMFPQQTDSWCWAASGQMIMSQLGGFVSQCEQANQRFSRTDCCNSPTPSACIAGGWPEFEKYGFSYDTSGALGWADLTAQIAQRTPFAFSWGWDGGGGHMMVAIGYKVNTQTWVTINDPWAPNEGSQRDILYSDYVDGTGYTHWTDYYNVTRE